MTAPPSTSPRRCNPTRRATPIAPKSTPARIAVQRGHGLGSTGAGDAHAEDHRRPPGRRERTRKSSSASTRSCSRTRPARWRASSSSSSASTASQVPTVSYVDHNVLQFDNKNPEDHAYLRSWAARYGALYSRPGNGISHYLHLERFARPGWFLLGADSHTTMAGALGMLAIGAGATEVAVAMAGRPYVVERPQVAGVELRGRLRPWVQSKDVVLELLRRHGVRGGRGRIFEFFGDGVADAHRDRPRDDLQHGDGDRGDDRDLPERRADAGAGSPRRGARTSSSSSPPTPGPVYDEVETIDLGELEPLIALPVLARERRAGRRGRGDADAAGLRRLVRQLLVRGRRPRRRRCCAGGRSRRSST